MRTRPPWLRLGERIAVSRYTAAFVLLSFFLALSAWIVGANALHMTFIEQRIDESETLARGVKHLNPLGEDDYDGRTGGTTRWFARLLYPLGIHYLNTRMGGSTYDWPGILGSGGFHVREAFSDASFTAVRETADRDPNVQDFAFFMRSAFGVLAAGCFCLVLWALFARFNLAASAAYGSLVLASPLVREQFLAFYTETALFAIFNLAAFLCLRRRAAASWRRTAWLGVLSAAALSTKLTGLLIAVPAFLYVAFNLRGRRPGEHGAAAAAAAPRIELFLLLLLASLFVLNLDYASVSDYLALASSNVWHYATGHAIVEAGGLDYLARTIRDLGWLIVPLFLASLSWLARTPERRLIPVYALGACILLVVWSLLDASYYRQRNLASVYVAMSFVVALGAGDLMERLPAKWLPAKPIASAGLTLALLANGVLPVWGLPSPGGEFFGRIGEPVRACAAIGAIGLPQEDLRRLRAIAGGEVTALPRLRPPFVLSRNERLTSRPAVARFLEENPGHVFDGLDRYDCLVAYREGHTKQITNFFAPKRYTLQARVGDRFFYAR